MILGNRPESISKLLLFLRMILFPFLAVGLSVNLPACEGHPREELTPSYAISRAASFRFLAAYGSARSPGKFSDGSFFIIFKLHIIHKVKIEKLNLGINKGV